MGRAASQSNRRDGVHPDCTWGARIPTSIAPGLHPGLSLQEGALSIPEAAPYAP